MVFGMYCVGRFCDFCLVLFVFGGWVVVFIGVFWLSVLWFLVGGSFVGMVIIVLFG